MKESPIPPTTVRPLRVLGAIAGAVVVVVLLATVVHEGSYRYRLWRADSIWCATLNPDDGTLTQYYGAEACGY